MLKTAVIGAGVMGQNHIRILKEISYLTAFCDADEAAAAALYGRLGVPYYCSVGELLKQGDFEAVVVATPTSTHKKIALECMQAGKHVLVEKPLAANGGDALEICKAAEDAGVVLAVGHIERHNPVVAAIKKLLGEKALGDLISLSSRRVGPFPWRVKDVGAIIDLAVHDIDIARYLAGSEIKRVYAAGGSKLGKREDSSIITLLFGNGVTACVEVNWLTPVKIRRLGLTCMLKYADIDYTAQTVNITSSTVMDLDPSNLSHIPIESDNRSISLKKQEPLKNELLDFLAAIEEKRAPLVCGRDGAAAVFAADAALKSMKTGESVTL
jgi:UDP-N-acetylglucosamine 3-dehydrogenase